jgi:hypothetical protein
LQDADNILQRPGVQELVGTSVIQKHVLEKRDVIAMLLVKAKRLVGAEYESARIKAAVFGLDDIEPLLEFTISQVFEPWRTAKMFS